MPPRRRRAPESGRPAGGGGAPAPATAVAAQAGIEDLPDAVLSTIFTMAGPLEEIGPAISATCTRFRRALLSDPERWCSFQLGPPPQHHIWSAGSGWKEEWLGAKLGLLRRVAGLVETFCVPDVKQLLDWAKPCRGSWSLQRFLARLDPQALTSLRLEGMPGTQAQLAVAGRFTGLTALELSSSTTPLPRNTAAVVGALAELRFLSLYCWGGSTARWDQLPRLTRLPEGVVSQALPRLSYLTYLQLGAWQVPPASQLTCLSGTLQLLSLFDQAVPTGGLPSPPARADWPLLTSYSVDWDMIDWRTGKQFGAYLLASMGCTLTYGATTSTTGRPAEVAAEVRVASSFRGIGGPLQGLLGHLLPAGAALTQLTLQHGLDRCSDSLAALLAPALSELQALALQGCRGAWLQPLLECAPHTTQLSFSADPTCTQYWHASSPEITALPAAMVALPLRRVVLHVADLPDLPAGRWLEELEELDVRVVRRLPAALAGTPIRCLALKVGAYRPSDTAALPPPTVADADNSLLLMPRLERLALSGLVPGAVLQHLQAQAPHMHITYKP